MFYVITILLCLSCNPVQKNDKGSTIQTTTLKPGSLQIDTTILKETFQEADTAYNDYLNNKLKPIRENFKRINSISSWKSVVKSNLDESSEGGEATFYYSNKGLEKIVARHFGETFQLLTEYYLLHGQLSFVFEKTYRYNRPFYYDSTAMKKSNDSEVFDIKKSGIIEDRSYFNKGKLIHQVNNQDCGTPFTKAYLLNEQKRIVEDFDKLKGIK